MDTSTSFIIRSNEILFRLFNEASKVHFLGFKSPPLQSITRVLYMQAVYFLSYCHEIKAPYIKYINEAEQMTSRKLAYPADSKPVAKKLKQEAGDEALKELTFTIDRLILMNKSFVHGNHIYFKIEEDLGVFLRQKSRPIAQKDLNSPEFYLKLWLRTIFIIRQFQNPVIILHVYGSYVKEALQNGGFVQTREAQKVFSE